MTILGGITDVPGASENVEIQDLARYAVEDHNQKQNDTLQYLRVISAKQQVVKGINYFITLEARRGGLLFVYETKVWVFSNIKEVLEFNPVVDSTTNTETGQIFDVPPDSIEIENVARFAVDQYNKDENANLVFVRAIHAKKQVVQGFNYFITLEAKDGDSKNVYVTKVWEFLSAKHLLEFYALLDNGTTVTETGQIFDVPPGSIEIENVARFAVDQYNKKENTNLVFVRAIQAKKQVVQGFNYFIALEAKDGEITRKYGTKVWEFMNSKQLLKFHILLDYGTTLTKTGQIFDVPANTVEIENVARFAVDQYNKNEHANLVFVRAIHAKKQVVQGFNYFITLEAKDGDIIKVYETKVWEFLNSKELLEFHVLISNGTTSTETGQIFDVPADSVEIENVARFAVHQHNKDEHANLVFVRAIHAKKQVVQGFNYFITLEAKDGEIKRKYETKVWEFSNSKQLLEFHILVDNGTTSTQTGQIFDVPANTVEIENVARFAVDQYNKNKPANLVFVRAIHAKKQVVHGFNYFITLEAKDGDIIQVYETKVWAFSNCKELLEFHLFVSNGLTLTKTGQIFDVPADSIEIENVARFAVDQYNKKENTNLVFVRAIQAKKQVVQGFNYFIALEAKDGEITRVYGAKVWEFLKSKQLLEFHILPGYGTSLTKPGQIFDVPANTVEIENVARFAVEQHNKKEPANLVFVRAIHAKKQVVQGFNYFITLEAKDGDVIKVYETKVWEFSNSKELLEFKLLKGAV
ncbi:unnamed protein product [Sphenostylis stenocarpa]|uniref:Cysteine proteinase inhibitor n=1 Tax=Sphenostylis stenocarpa TaxID=92480 RepID=A0AA86VN75_9FABA|nr:unnamed protein product [Sphenostylis stenocarpa]